MRISDWSSDVCSSDLPHLNGIARTSAGELMIAAERGSAFRSRDGGVTWERIALPYGGSMFGAVAWEAGHVLMYGLRGKVFETTDLGDSRSEEHTSELQSLMRISYAVFCLKKKK